MALAEDAKFSLISFIFGLLVLFVLRQQSGGDVVSQVDEYPLFNFPLCFFALGYAGFSVCVLWMLRYQADFQVTLRACLLGVAFGSSLYLATSSSPCRLIGWYIAVLAFFHWSEYFATGVTNPRNLTLSSYILDHSFEYHAACLASLVEFAIECYLFPALKRPGWLSVIGLSVVIGGETLRKLAMWQASTNFNHYIRHIREDGHRLVTDGIYARFRHPSYVGWFYWSIATQVMIMNPICAVLYMLASWHFFHTRVYEEERTLVDFFGSEYVEYQRRVPTGLPFIEGFKVPANWINPAR